MSHRPGRSLPAIAACIVALLTCAAAFGAKPKITVGQDVWDFGTIWHGERVSKDVSVKNEGDADLKIVRIRASCGCTAGSAKKSLLAPGEETTVAIVFDSANKSGPISTQVNLFSNDPDRRQVTVMVEGHVNRELSYDPLGGCVSRVLDKNATPIAKCTVKNTTTDQPMKLELKSVDSPKFDVSVREVEAGKIYEVLSAAKPPFEPGRQMATAHFTTGLQREKELTISLVVDLLDRVQLSPPAILVDADMIRTPTNRGVSLMYYGDRPDWTILGVDSSHPSVTAQTSPARTPEADYLRLTPPPTLLANVNVQLPPGKDIPKDGVMLTVRTDEPGYEQIQILVTTNGAEFQRIIKKNRR